MATHPEQTLLTGKAGTVVVFNSHTWHGGTVNRHDLPRRALHSAFTRRELPQQESLKDYVSAETADRLSAAALYIVDIETDEAVINKPVI
jgi:ectoine hydroxylase-related dioxygenase (phytanoyl-CoA dioxygenase family)